MANALQGRLVFMCIWHSEYKLNPGLYLAARHESPVMKIFYFLFPLFIWSCQAPQSDAAPGDTAAEEVEAERENGRREKQPKVILFFGNSLTAGYGVEASESFPALIQARIDSLGIPYEVVNAGVSGETSATGLNRIDWVMGRQQVDIFVLELGANDGLRGLPPAETRRNLESIIGKVRNQQPGTHIVLAGMMVPPSMGADYSAAYNRIFPEIAAEKEVFLIPFLLENVGGIDSLNQADGIHPNPAGNRVVVENVWPVLAPLLEGHIHSGDPVGL